jgi:hypothetical protein
MYNKHVVFFSLILIKLPGLSNFATFYIFDICCIAILFK